MMDKKTNTKTKAPQQKVKAAKKEKKSKMPEGYIGRPKPMKTKKQFFHKPTTKNWIELGIFVVFAAFLTYIVIRLVQVAQVHELDFEYYEISDAQKDNTYVLENNDIRFELDVATTQFTVTQKNNGHVWYSNPQGIDSDPIALTKEKNYMRSPFLIKYSTENGSDDVYDVYTNSISRNFYDVQKDGDKIIVNYTVGQMDREYIFPLAIYEEELLAYEENLSRSQISAINRAYHKFDINNLKASDNEEELLEKYPNLKNENLYLVFENIQTYLKEQMEDIFASVGYTYDDYTRHKEMYKESNIKEVPAFNISVTYEISGDSLVLTIPFEDISYKRKYPITQLSVLPYFAAGGSSDEGFMLVPEGGGSLIYFNNGKTRQNGYYADVYGWDLATDRKALITETRVAYPVFGVSFGDSSVISIIEEGAPYAGITAEIAGKLGSFNYVRADYKMLHREQFEVSTRNTSAQYSYEPSLPAGEKIKQVYKFIDSNSYVDMAKSYREYLFGGSQKVNNSVSPLAVEIVGAIDKVQQVAGMPKTKPYKLTSYSETADIIKELDEMGIKDANIKLTGYINEGIKSTYLKKFKLISELGGRSQFKKLIKNASESSSKLYLDGSVQTAHRSGWAEGFLSYRDAARFASDEIVELYEYSPIWYGKLDTMDTYYLLTQDNIVKCTEVLTKNALKFGLDGISYRDNGYQLSGDYDDNGVTSRNTSMINQVQAMKDAKEKGLGVMINGGNDYAIKNVDFVTNLDLHGNSYAILDTPVPFYQIALHGYVNYSGSPVNLGYEKDQIVLESAESGAGLLFTFMKASEEALQETHYTEYYAANFDSWKPQFNDIYTRYNKEVGKVANSCISNHAYLSDSVTCTTFDNGYKIFVNFGYVDYQAENGQMIPAREYKVVKEVR